jgi:putative transcriptional regulator
VDSLRGRLLISGGGLFDPNFRHTVVLVGEHGQEGAVGVVLNRPMDVTVKEAVPPLSGLVGSDDRLFEGGPVRPRQPVLLVEVERPELLDVPVFGSVGFLTGDVPAHLRSAIRRARIFAGHAGWGTGQLEAEMDQGSWILEPAREDDVFTGEPDQLWRRVLQRKGPKYRAISRIPFDPSMN